MRDPDNCHDFTPTYIGVFQNDEFLFDQNIPDLFTPILNFHKCPVNAVAVENAPYTIVEKNSSNHTLDGVDIHLMNAFAERLNVTIAYSLQARGIISPNGSISGSLGMVSDGSDKRDARNIKLNWFQIFRGDAEIGLGGYFITNERELILESSFPYTYAAELFAITAGPVMDPLENLIRPYNIDLWSSLGVLFLVATLVILLLKRCPSRGRHFIIGGYRNRSPILNMISIYFGNSITIQNGRGRRAFSCFAKTLFIIWTVGCLVLRNAYQGSLYGFLQKEHSDRSLDTIEKVIHSNCPVHSSFGSIERLKTYNIERNR